MLISVERATEIAELYYNDIYRLCLSRLKREEDASDVFGINAKDTAIDKGELNIAGYADVASQLSEEEAAV